MKFIVFNGNPKGNMSVSLQYVKFIQKSFPMHQFVVMNVSHNIHKLQKNHSAFMNIIEQVKTADGIIWASPVYYYLVPSQLKRFIELMFEKRVNHLFKDKYTATLLTSAHFFDHTVHNYINGICDDLKMRYAGGFLPHMFDLPKKEIQKSLLVFAKNFFSMIESHTTTEIAYAPISYDRIKYCPDTLVDKPKSSNKKIIVLTDEDDPSTNIGKMIATFTKCLSNPVKAININNIHITGSCIGCMYWLYVLVVCIVRMMAPVYIKMILNSFLRMNFF
jgi:NAD(P)H-dependent FMN reductase